MRRIFSLAALLLIASLGVQAIAADKADSPDQALREKLAKQFPEAKITDVRKTPVSGIYEVSIGGDIGYVTADGNYLLHGELIELKTQQNLTENRRAEWRRKVVAGIGEQNMIVFGPKKPKHTITVFTDIDCGYCRLLHQNITGYEKEGIAVRYAFFPRSGPNTDSFRKAEAVWCAKDRRDALTRAKKGENLPAGKCKTPVAQQYQAALEMGVRGTPAIIAADGRLIAGYLPPPELRKQLEGAAH